MKSKDMSWVHTLMLCSLLCVAANIMRAESKQFHIKDTPSYLYYRFNGSTEEIVTNDISITFSLSKVEGTLMYSIDSNLNQIILTLVDLVPYRVDLEVNKQVFTTNLPSLCGCEWCRYETMVLRIQVAEYIQLQCNERDIQRKLRISSKRLNDNYPILYLQGSTNPKYSEAHMWLINTPRYQALYPNPEQMQGCIFDVKYIYDSINVTNHTRNIADHCARTCTKDICNGGQCYETYDTSPICNCTSTFLNGRFCNDSMTTKNLRTTSPEYMINMIKLSWRSSVNGIFQMNNSNTVVKIGRDKSNLFFECQSGTGSKMVTKVTLTNEYAPDTEYVCIITIEANILNIRLSNNQSWVYLKVPIKLDLRKEIFSSLSLRSGLGVIDLVTKKIEDYQWNYAALFPYVQLENETIPLNATIPGRPSSLPIILPVVIISILAVVCVVTVPIVLTKKRVQYAKINEEKSRVNGLRNQDYLLSKNIFSNEKLEKFKADYNASKINSELIECLRQFNVNNYHNIYTDEERINYLSFLNYIIHLFWDENKSKFSDIISIIKTSGEVIRWKVNCYTLAMSLLSKINDKTSSNRLIAQLKETLDILGADSINKNIQSVIESCLSTMCNLIRRSGITLKDNVFSNWLPYTRLGNNDFIKLSSSYIIMFFHNRGKISGISDKDISVIMQYVQQIYVDEIRTLGKKDYKGFFYGTFEKAELCKAFPEMKVKVKEEVGSVVAEPFSTSIV